MPDELAPFLEVGRAAEVDGVVLERLPAHEQPIAGRLLERALQLHPLAAPRPLEDRSGLGDPLLERRFHARLDLDLRDLEDHAPLLPKPRPAESPRRAGSAQERPTRPRCAAEARPGRWPYP